MHRVCSWVPHAREPLPAWITPQRAARLQAMHECWPMAHVLTIAERGPGDRLTPQAWEVVYVMAGQGPYGRPAEIRLGADLALQEGHHRLSASRLRL